MNTAIKKISIFMFIVVLLSYLIIPVQVNAASPCEKNNGEYALDSYYNFATFSFVGTSSSILKSFDGTFMAIEATATSSSGQSQDVTISVYIQSRNITKNYTVKSNGTMKKFDYIFLGFSGGSDVAITCSCNSSDTITMNLTSYSW